MKLYDYMRPKSELFMPRNYNTLLSTLSTPLIGQPSLNVSNATAGYTTPMPESSFSSSPAWDPNSHLPELELEQSSPLAGPSHLPVPCANKHILLDPRLLDAQLKVTVGGPHHNKEQNVTINSSNGQLSIVHTHYKTSTALTPEWVTPRHPSATHDNGLLVVIKGEDCGKYVRRIYHRFDGEKPIMLLAVVNRLAGQADTLTEGRLELDVSYLCLCNDKDHKEENSQLMKGLRQAARKIRAK